VAQLTRDLQPLVSSQTTMTANEAGNSIVITDTQANIRRVAEIIKAIDMGAEDVTEVRVFRLENSDPLEISELLTSLFPDETRSTGGSRAPVQFGGFSRFFRPPGSTGSSSTGASSGNQNQRMAKRARVLAVPDPRTSSVVVSAAKDLMGQIEAVVLELDGSNARRQSVHVYQLQNADPEEVRQVLQNMFERNSTTGSRNQGQNASTLSNRRTTQGTTRNTGTRTGTSQLQTGRTGIGR
jgi:general secretion pathway protein D